MLKKINLFILMMLSAMIVIPFYSIAQTSSNSSIVLLDGGQDTLSYKLITSGEKNILTYLFGFQIKQFHTDCLLTPSDFKNGDASGTVELPANAKVCRIKLDGYNNGGLTTKINVTTYINNTELPEIPQRDMGYLLYDDILNLCGTYKYTDAKVCQFPNGTSTTNRLTLLDLPFVQPFIYTGGNVAIVLDMKYDENNPMNFYYNTATASNHSTVIRSDSYGSAAIGGDLPTLPANNILYFTNDLRGTLTDINGTPIVENVDGKNADETGPYVRLVDLTTSNLIGLIHPAIDGSFNFFNLNPNHVYHLSASSYSYGYIEKNVAFIPKNGSLDFANDILAIIQMEKSVITGLNEFDSGSGITVLGSKSSIIVVADRSANVAVYDVTGRLVRQANVKVGSNSIDGIAPGIYIVNRVKIAVK